MGLVEVGSRYTAGELVARAYLPEPIPVGRQLEQRYLRRVHHLPPEVQEFVLLAAADASGDRSRVRQPAAAAGIDADTAEAAAEAAQLINVSGNWGWFGASADPGGRVFGRRRAHLWLSRASARHGDPDWQLWHSAAATGPDERLAADLQAAAECVRIAVRGLPRPPCWDERWR